MPKKRPMSPQVVFVGCPWKTIRPKYERVFQKKTFKRRFPLDFVIIGRDGNQLAKDLFAEIKRRIESSSCAILDVSGGNANVALEFGYAEGKDISCFVFANEHKASKGSGGGPQSPIISDLSGLRRNTYKNEATLEKLLIQFSERHAYTKRVGKVIKKYQPANKVKWVLVSIPRIFSNVERMRRSDLRDQIISETSYDEMDVNDAIGIAKSGRLIEISVGQYGYTTLVP